MDWFRVSDTETADSSAVETAVEGDDRHLGYPRHLAHHGTGQFLRSEVHPTSSHFLSIFHEHQLHGVLVAAGAAHHGDDVLSPGRGDPHQDVLQSVAPIVPWDQSGQLSLVQSPRDTELSFVDPYYAGAKVYAITTQGSNIHPTGLCCYGTIRIVL